MKRYLSLQGVHYVETRHCLALGMFGVGDSVADDTLEESLENSASFYIFLNGPYTFINQARDTFDSASTSETTDCGLGDSLDVVSQN
jgi:hypothetical protein